MVERWSSVWQSLVRVALVCLILTAFARPAFAAGDVFTVRSIPVDATAATALEARDVAIAQGRTTALLVLMKRLTPEAQWGLLPALSPQEVLPLSRGYEIEDEKLSDTRYLGRISYSFQPSEVRGILQSRTIPFSETQSRPMVVYPVLLKDGQADVWSEGNAWRRAWAARDLSNELTPVLAPLGDFGDLSAAPVSLLEAPTHAAFKPFADRYGVSDVLIAKATDPGGPGLMPIEVIKLSPEGQEIIKLNVPVADGTANALTYAVDEVVAKLTEKWKQKTLVGGAVSGPTSTVTAVVEFLSLADWLAIDQVLRSTPVVASTRLQALSAQSALVELAIADTPEKVAVILAQRNVSFEPRGASVDPYAAAQPGVAPVPAPQEYTVRLGFGSAPVAQPTFSPPPVPVQPAQPGVPGQSGQR